MASYFIDLDGVFFKKHTMKPTRNAINYVNKLMMRDNQVYFVTKRTYNPEQQNNVPRTKKALKELGVRYTKIIGDVDSPRVVINDEGALAINHEANQPLRYPILSNYQLRKQIDK